MGRNRPVCRRTRADNLLVCRLEADFITPCTLTRGTAIGADLGGVYRFWSEGGIIVVCIVDSDKMAFIAVKAHLPCVGIAILLPKQTGKTAISVSKRNPQTGRPHAVRSHVHPEVVQIDRSAVLTFTDKDDVTAAAHGNEQVVGVPAAFLFCRDDAAVHRTDTRNEGHLGGSLKVAVGTGIDPDALACLFRMGVATVYV